MKKKTVVFIFIFFGLALVLTALLLKILSQDSLFKNKYITVNRGNNIEILSGPYKEHNRYVFESKQISELHIDWMADNINIYTHDSDEILVIESCQRTLSTEETLYLSIDSNVLSIKYMESVPRGTIPPKQLDIAIPPSAVYMLNNINITNTVGYIYVVDVSTDKLTINSSVGDCTLENIAVKNLYCNSSVGNTFIEGVFDTCSVKNNTGDISLTIQEDYGRCAADLETSTGNILLKIPENFGKNIYYSTSVGSFSTDLPVVISNKQDADIIMQSSVGSIRIRKNRSFSWTLSFY